MAMGLGDALKKYFGTGTGKAGAATTNLITLRKQLQAAEIAGNTKEAARIRALIAQTQRPQAPRM